MNAVLDGGFADPVLDSQQAFRSLMEALARPGRVQPLRFLGRPPAPLTPELAAVALTLVDQDTAVWLDAPLAAASEVREWLAFQCGAKVTADPAAAAFALATSARYLPEMVRFAQGTDAYPDRSTTVALHVASLDGGPPMHLNGPGIRGICRFAPVGLPDGFARQWAENRAQYPRGIDLLLVAAGAAAGLPRRVSLEV